MLHILKNEAATNFSEIYFTASKILSTKDHSNDITNIIDGKTTFQEILRNKWLDLFNEAERADAAGRTSIYPTINASLDKVKTLQGGSDENFVLVTGSLYLVGGYLELLSYNTTPK